MLPAAVKNKIEQIWLDVIAGGVSQPTEVIENYFPVRSKSIYLESRKKNRRFVGEILRGWRQENFIDILFNRWLIMW